MRLLRSMCNVTSKRKNIIADETCMNYGLQKQQKTVQRPFERC